MVASSFGLALPAERPISVSVDNGRLLSVTGGEVLAEGDRTAILVGHGDNPFAVVQLESYSDGPVPVHTEPLQDEGVLEVDAPRETSFATPPAVRTPSLATKGVASGRETINTSGDVVEYSIESHAPEPTLIGASCSTSVLVAVFDEQNHPVAASATPETHDQSSSTYETEEMIVVSLPVGRYHAVFASDDYYVNSPLECTVVASSLADHIVTGPTDTVLHATPGRTPDAYLIKPNSDAVVIVDSARNVAPSLRCGPTAPASVPDQNGRLVDVVPAAENCVVVLTPLPGADTGTARLRLLDAGTTTGGTP